MSAKNIQIQKQMQFTNIVNLYKEIFHELIGIKEKPVEIYLPSDVDWQEKMYYVLLDIQKNINNASDGTK